MLLARVDVGSILSQTKARSCHWNFREWWAVVVLFGNTCHRLALCSLARGKRPL